MSRAKDIFERLRNQGLAALDDLIADREPESLFLDFKRSPDDGSSRVLADDDSKNLCKAISGFANSSGGVVIWGVDCRRDASGNEVAIKMPLADAHGFNTKLQGAISRSTVPPHPDVEVIVIPEGDEGPSGFVAVLVPQSTFGPVRSLKSHQYHLRTGSDFSVVPHDLLAGMFGRAPRPEVHLNLIFQPARLNLKPEHLTVVVGLVVVNLGAVLAERPYISVQTGDIPRDTVAVFPKDTKSIDVRRGLLPVLSAVAKPDFALPPGGAEHLFDLAIDIPVNAPRGLEFECVLGAAGAPPNRFNLKASLEAVAHAIDRSKTERVMSSDIVTLLPDL